MIKADQLIQLTGVPADGRVLDIGCGQGEFLIQVIEATGAHGLGIDIDGGSITMAREKAEGRVVDGKCEFREGDARTESLDEHSFDLALCIGSTHAFGMGEDAYANTLRALMKCVRTGGRLLVGEGYWKQSPAPEYLDLIGEPVGIYRDHAGNVSFAESQGLTPLYAAVSNQDEWDHFEWSHKMGIEREAALHPGDASLAAKLKRSREWRDGYLRWGRSTMGFGFYLFQNPAPVENGAR